MRMKPIERRLRLAIAALVLAAGAWQIIHTRGVAGVSSGFVEAGAGSF